MKNLKIHFVLFVTLLLSCSDNQKNGDGLIEEKTTKSSFWVGDTSGNIHGIDISHHQKEIDWKKVKENGVSFVFVKATEGVDYLDSMFVENWEDLQKENIIRGAYHFYVSDDDPIQQAEWFVKNAVNFAGVLPPVMDVERAGHNHVTPEQYRINLIKCLNHLEQLTGLMPIIYSSPNFAKKYLAGEEFGKYNLWIAEYGVEKPVVPEAWQKPGWDFWQNTYQDEIPGVQEKVDRNIFKGKFHHLLDMVNQ